MPEQLTLSIEQECDEPRSYSELSPEAQARAIERWRDRIGELWDSNDNDEITETLVNDLKYEYGIEVSTHTEKGLRGKTYDVPDIEWKLSYCQGDWITTRNSCSMRKESRNDSKTTAAMFPLRS